MRYIAFEGGVYYAQNISAFCKTQKDGARFQKENEHQKRKKGACKKKKKGQKGAVRIMQKTESIKLNRDFRWLYNKGDSRAASEIVIYFKKRRREGNRLGLTVSKKVGCAVVRNRIRRLIKENYRLREDRLKSGYDMVIVARSSAASSDFHRIGKAMDYLFHKCGLFEE